MTLSLVRETLSPERRSPSQAGGAPSVISEALSPARGAQLLTGGVLLSAGGASSEDDQLTGTVCLQGLSMTGLQNLLAKLICPTSLQKTHAQYEQ